MVITKIEGMKDRDGLKEKKEEEMIGGQPQSEQLLIFLHWRDGKRLTEIFQGRYYAWYKLTLMLKFVH